MSIEDHQSLADTFDEPPYGGEDYTQAPHNIEVEQALLGAILVNNQACELVSHFLKPEHFFDQLHARIYEAMVILIEQGRAVSPVTLKTYFDTDEALNEIGGAAYIASLVSGAITVIGAEDYGRTIFEIWQRRQLFDICREGFHSATNTRADQSPDDLISAVSAEIDDIGRETAKSTFTTPSMAYEAFVSEKPEDNRIGIQTGLKSIDEVIGGLFPAEMTVIGARPSMGKTALGIVVALNTSSSGTGTLFISLEMTSTALFNRLYTAHSWQKNQGIAYSDIRKNKLMAGDRQRLVESAHAIAEIPLIIEDRRGIKVQQLPAIIRRARRQLEASGHSLDLVVIDHLDLLLTDNFPGNKVAQTGDKSNRLREISRDQNVHILPLVQLNRDVEKRDDKRPSMADLRWSGEIEQDADNVLFLYREGYYLERMSTRNMKPEDEADHRAELSKFKNWAEVIIAKQRQGELKTVTLMCDMASNTFRDSSQQQEGFDL